MFLLALAPACRRDGAWEGLIRKTSDRRVAAVDELAAIQRRHRDVIWADPAIKKILLMWTASDAKPLTETDATIEETRAFGHTLAKRDLDREVNGLQDFLTKDKAYKGQARTAMAKKVAMFCIGDARFVVGPNLFRDRYDRFAQGQIHQFETNPGLKGNAVCAAQIKIYEEMLAYHQECSAACAKALADIEALWR
jgi:hypothetical protein